MPNASLLKQYRPGGVMNVLRRRDSLARGSCQNPLLALSLEKNFAPDSCTRVSSSLDRGWTSLRML